MSSRGITSIAFMKLNGTPAMVHRETGQLLIDPDQWKQLPPAHRAFILFHEHVHTYNIRDEMKADEEAWKLYRKRGWPVTEGIKALSKVLKKSSQENRHRRYAQVLRAMKDQGYDISKWKKNNPELKPFV